MTAPAPAPASRPRSLRRRLRTLAYGLLVYGLVGLLLAVSGLATALILQRRVADVSSTISERAVAIEAALAATADALGKSATAADSFAVTLEATAPAIGKAATTLSSAATATRSAAAAAGAVDILGHQPLSGLASSLDGIAQQLDQLAGQVGALSSAVDGDQAALSALAASLRSLQAAVLASSESLAANVSEGLDAVSSIMAILVIATALWLAFPAVGALLLGLWLLRAAAPRPLPTGAPEGTAGA